MQQGLAPCLQRECIVRLEWIRQTPNSELLLKPLVRQDCADRRLFVLCVRSLLVHGVCDHKGMVKLNEVRSVAVGRVVVML